MREGRGKEGKHGTFFRTSTIRRTSTWPPVFTVVSSTARGNDLYPPPTFVYLPYLLGQSTALGEILEVKLTIDDRILELLGLAVVPCMRVCVRAYVGVPRDIPISTQCQTRCLSSTHVSNILCLVHISFTSARQQWFSHSLTTSAQTEPVCGFY